ncbi:ATP-binding cassette domain-containing protein [Streptococcus didelphis]|uniref:ATP-binding cassette domain-containing protein n=1 Tax=Streptococcus didelphis TaxID=102886 RepID=A0ABY9LJ33_9STRE|nr:ATP-binding cassette domain-containing protein [Streptococcus didelphis]WMB28838.1 ATP-binding cassette domain-containing protein [Streptococcus didelphis]
MSLLSFDNVSFEVAQKRILDQISFTVEEGDFMSIVGPSGSGKSSLLKLASSLISPSKGDILFYDNSLEDLDLIAFRKEVSYCFQTPYLFGESVEDNIDFPFTIRNKEVDQKRVKELFALFKMDIAYLKEDVKKLSGGEKQRIALIRQLLFPPKLLLLDEVTSALDAVNKEIVETVITNLHENGVTILWVTHDLEQSRKYANKIMTIIDGKLDRLELIK